MLSIAIATLFSMTFSPFVTLMRGTVALKRARYRVAHIVALTIKTGGIIWKLTFNTILHTLLWDIYLTFVKYIY